MAGVANSQASITPLSRAGYTSPPGRLTTLAPSRSRHFPHIPTVLNFSPLKSARELIGFLIRYVVDLGEISVRAYLWPGEEDYGPGTRVEVYFPPESALLFPYPEEGLARELALE